ACEHAGSAQWSGKLDVYVDGELDSAEASSLVAHLRGCAACATDVLGRVQVKRAVQIAGKRYTASAELRDRVAKTVAAKPRREGGWTWRILALPAVMVLLLSVGVNLYVGRERTRRERVYGELADLHVSALASATPVDVISTDRHTVKP